MKIGLIDVDGHNFPNMPLMKLSAWHKAQGDQVEWYNPLLSGHMDKVYMSKVFSFTPDYPYYINADKVIKGGSGYCIRLVNGKEFFDKTKNTELMHEIENMYPDYSIYYDKIPEVKNTAYGFLTRGCPNNCSHCHVTEKEGRCSVKAADLNMFWKDQKKIVLLDPNITACSHWEELFQQLIDSRAMIDFSQGLDMRLITEEKTRMLMQMRIKNIHFAWDDYKSRDIIVPKFKEFKKLTGLDKRQLTVYVLVNYNSTHEEDLERIYTLRELGYWPYVMIYNKDEFVECDKRGKPMRLKPTRELLKKFTLKEIEHFDICWDMQRWVNKREIFENTPRFEDYKRGGHKIG